MSEAKEYLEKIKWYDVLIDSKLEELANLNAIVKRITPVMNTTGGGSASGNQDKLGDTIAKIIDLQTEINRDVDMFVDRKREALKLLKKVKNADFYKVLHMRYVQYKSFVYIAAEMGGMSERGASKMNGRALQAFDKVLKAHNQKVLEEKEKNCTESS